jgi:hypothetical protein
VWILFSFAGGLIRNNVGEWAPVGDSSSWFSDESSAVKMTYPDTLFPSAVL